MMLLAALLFQIAAAEVSDRALYTDCARAAEEGIPGAIDAASRWVGADGGVAARHCLGLAYLGANKPAEASAAFEAAARISESAGSDVAAELYGQAGNAAMIAGDAVRAETLMTAAIVRAGHRTALKGALSIDRARAREARGNVAGARADLEAGVEMAPGDATGWLLLGTLARREERLADARAAIARALSLAPGDPDIRLEAGNMAAIDGDTAKARTLWAAIIQSAPGTPAAKAADEALLRNPE